MVPSILYFVAVIEMSVTLLNASRYVLYIPQTSHSGVELTRYQAITLLEHPHEVHCKTDSDDLPDGDLHRLVEVRAIA